MQKKAPEYHANPLDLHVSSLGEPRNASPHYQHTKVTFIHLLPHFRKDLEHLQELLKTTPYFVLLTKQEKKQPSNSFISELPLDDSDMAPFGRAPLPDSSALLLDSPIQ
jgi:hypothetical protein